MQSKRTILFLAFVLLCLQTAFATEVTRLDATRFTRTTGKPNVYSLTFGAIAGPGKLTVINGEPYGRHRVSSGAVQLNGQVLLSQHDLIHERTEFRFDVQLVEENSITIKLESAPGSFLIVSVSQLEPDRPPLLTGTVSDRHTGAPIPNATVSFYGSAYGTVFTDGNGRYTFSASNLNVFSGGISGTLYVAAPGYFEAVPLFIDDLASQPSLPVIRDVSLLPGGTVVQGVVRDSATGAAIAGATVTFNTDPRAALSGGQFRPIRTVFM